MVSSAPLSPFYDNVIANALQPSKLAAASRLLQNCLPRHSQSAIAKVQTSSDTSASPEQPKLSLSGGIASIFEEQSPLWIPPTVMFDLK